VAYVPERVLWDVTEFEISADGRRGAFVINEEGISRLYLFDPERQRYKRVKRTPMGAIGGLRFSPDGRRLGMTISTPRTPNDVFVLMLGRRPLSHGRLKQWTSAEGDGFDTSHFVEPELIHFPAPMITEERNLSMPAFYYRPKKARPPYPVIIQVHGGPEGQFRPVFDSTIQMWLDKLGTAVIAPNIRGSLGYGTAYLAMDDGLLRENAVRDIGALLDWIRDNPDLDESRVAIYGASYGGYMALASAVHFSDRLRAAVDRAGISHFVSYLENTQDYRRDLRRTEYGDERDPEMRSFLQRISPLNNVDRIGVPLLIAQGRNDPIVPETESAQMVNALRQRGQTVWYMNARNEGHTYQRKENRDLFGQLAFLFLQTYLLGD
jgi:dipeptidyl aminopeptidase/acylaminoacyl peptidase